MRFLSSLVAVAFLVVACGADGSDVVGDDLALAQQEIARLEALLAEQSEVADTEEPAASEVSGTPYSVGPCGTFALNGTRVMKSAHKPEEELPVNFRENDLEWVETGVDFGKEHDAQYAFKQQGGWNWTARSPSVSFGVRLALDWNHAWYVEWEVPDRRPEFRDADIPRENWSAPGPRGFFGLDQNCDWHWIGPSDTWPYHGALSPASLRLEVGEDGEAQLVEYTVRTSGCPGFYQDVITPPAIYDLESHTFIIQCPDE